MVVRIKTGGKPTNRPHEWKIQEDLLSRATELPSAQAPDTKRPFTADGLDLDRTAAPLFLHERDKEREDR